MVQDFASKFAQLVEKSFDFMKPDGSLPYS